LCVYVFARARLLSTPQTQTILDHDIGKDEI